MGGANGSWLVSFAKLELFAKGHGAAYLLERLSGRSFDVTMDASGAVRVEMRAILARVTQRKRSCLLEELTIDRVLHGGRLFLPPRHDSVRADRTARISTCGV